MSTDTTAAEKSAATTDDEPTITRHVEPAAVGGEPYVRCEDCGREVIGRDPSRLLHAEGCSGA